MSQVLTLVGVAMNYGGPLVLGGMIVFALMRYLATGRAGVIPIRIYPGQAVKLFEAAQAGNKPMVIEALRKAFEFDLASSPLTSVIAEWALDDVQKRMKDPSHPALIVNAIAKFTGLTPDEVFETVKEDFTPKPPAPVVAPVAAVLAMALFLGFADSAQASYPLGPSFTSYSHFNSDVQAPQQFYATDRSPIMDPPLMRNKRGELVAYEATPVIEVITYEFQMPAGTQQPVAYAACHDNGVYSWWDGGPVRRFISNGNHPVARGAARVGRGAVRVVTAPFRWLFRRGRC